jgi:hypothetical protein
MNTSLRFFPSAVSLFLTITSFMFLPLQRLAFLVLIRVKVDLTSLKSGKAVSESALSLTR